MLYRVDAYTYNNELVTIFESDNIKNARTVYHDTVVNSDDIALVWLKEYDEAYDYDKLIEFFNIYACDHGMN